MLAIRPCCEHCGKPLPNTATDAMICSFECTYCASCAIHIFENVCPSCGGNFQKRPIRPAKYMEKYPSSAQKILKPKSIADLTEHIAYYKNKAPENR